MSDSTSRTMLILMALVSIGCAVTLALVGRQEHSDGSAAYSDPSQALPMRDHELGLREEPAQPDERTVRAISSFARVWLVDCRNRPVTQGRFNIEYDSTAIVREPDHEGAVSFEANPSVRDVFVADATAHSRSGYSVTLDDDLQATLKFDPKGWIFGTVRTTIEPAPDSIDVIAVPESLLQQAVSLSYSMLADASTAHAIAAPDGSYLICGLDASQSYRVIAGSRGFLPRETRKVTATRNGARADIELLPSFSCCVELVDAQGQRIQKPPALWSSGASGLGVDFFPTAGIEPLYNDWTVSLLTGIDEDFLQSKDGRIACLFVATREYVDRPAVEITASAFGFEPRKLRCELTRTHAAPAPIVVSLDPLDVPLGKVIFRLMNTPSCGQRERASAYPDAVVTLRRIGAGAYKTLEFRIDALGQREVEFDQIPAGRYMASVRAGAMTFREPVESGTSHQIEASTEPLPFDIDFAATGCLELIPRRADGESYTGFLRLAVRYDPDDERRIQWVDFASPPYLVPWMAAGEYRCELVMADGTRRLLRARIDAGEYTRVETEF